MGTDFGKASMTDVNAVKTLLAAAPVPKFCEGADCFADKVRFCVNLNAVKFLIEEVSHLVDMCVKPAGYLCAPPSFCNSEACGKTENRIMLTACLKSQPSKKFELAAFVQHGPGRNASFSGCEAAHRKRPAQHAASARGVAQPMRILRDPPDNAS